MRIMPIAQQNLNNRPCVKNNQPNFKGVFVKEMLGELDKSGSIGARILDAFKTLVEKGTDSLLKVTARGVKPEETNSLCSFMVKCPELEFRMRACNLRVICLDIETGKEIFMDEFVSLEKNPDAQQNVNQTLLSLLKGLVEKVPEHMNLEGLVTALKKE